MARKSVIALLTVGVLIAFFTVCLVSATQELKPRDMPFGVTGPSSVVSAVQTKLSLDLKTYSSQSELLAAAGRGDIYGGYVPGQSRDTLVTVPAKSFFGEVYVRAGFADAAKKDSRTFTTTTVAPLPTADRTGALVGLLLLPTLIGGYLIATMLFSVSQTAAVRGRIPIVLCFSVLVALITGIVAGPLLGAVPNGDTWALLPCFALVTAAIALAAVALQSLIGKLGTMLVVVLFIIVGGASAGGAGVSLLPTLWQDIGALLPPRYAVELYRNVRYFDGQNITQPIVILAAYALVSAAVVIIATRRRPNDQPEEASTSATAAEPPQGRRRLVTGNLVAPVAFAVILTTLFAVNYMSSGHEPVANNMPFGVVGSPALANAAQGDLFSLDVKQYSDETAVTDAMNRGEIYGALVTTSGAPALTVVSSISDISPLDIASNVERAAKKAGETVTVKSYAPTALAPKDPFALVVSTLIVTLLIAGYMSAALLATAVGTASARWRGVWLAGFAALTGLALDLIVTYGLDGLPTSSFWIVWPILTLIILAVGLFAAVLRRVMGPAGIFVTLILILQFGNPSSGGSNGAAYLTSFWHDIGPLLPPRNAFVLLRNTVYFDGNGTSQALIVLLLYLVIAAVILGFLDWFRSPELTVPGIDQANASESAAVSVPVGPLP